jgi:outer membrane immunogenic protein
MKKLIALAAVATLAAPAVYAGSPTAPAIEPMVTAPAAAPVLVDWNGPYAGGTFGFARTSFTNADGDRENETNPGIAGHVGYNADMGNWVVGGEFLLAPGFNQTVGNREVRWGAAARVKAGPKFGARGETWGFGTVGLAHARHRVDGTGDDARSSNGWLVGVGASHMVQNNVFVTGEINHTRFNGDDDVRSTGVALGVSFRF